MVGGLPTPQTPHCMPSVASQIESLRDTGVSVDVLNRARGCHGWRKYAYGIAEIQECAKSARWDMVRAHYSYCGWVARAQVRAPVVGSPMGSDVLAVTSYLEGSPCVF